MKKLKIITISLILSVTISSCEKESIDLPLEESIQNPIVTLEDYINSGGTVGPFEIKQVAGKNDNLKSHITIGDIDIYNNKEEFLSNSSNLYYEDFTGPYAPVYDPLNEFSDDGAFSPGDIPEGISFGTLNVNNSYNDFLRFDNNLILRLFSTDPEVDLKLTMDFSLKVQKVAFDVINLNIFGIISEGTTIVVEGANGVIHTQNVYPTNTMFFGIQTQEPITRILIYHDQGNMVVGVDNVYFGEFPDTDSDGCIDQKDAIPSSNMEKTILIKDCDTKVENRKTSSCGIMMADAIDALENKTYSPPSSFRTELMDLTSTWVNEEIISSSERTSILGCAVVVGPTYVPAPWWPNWPCKNPFRRCR